MLQVDLRDLRRGPVETTADLQPDDVAFAGLSSLRLARALAVRGRLQSSDRGEYFWRATLRGEGRGECPRCLADVSFVIDTPVNVLFSLNPDAADDPSVYPLPPEATHVDLRGAIREELALSVPEYPLCREDCAGLCPRCGADLNAGPCGCSGTAT